jgi:teichuronic acid biosynthesis glycosyltransferase TuaC
VTPTAYVPPPLLKLPMFSAHRGMVYRQWWKGIEVFRPRTISVSRFGTTRMWVHARNCCVAAMPLCASLHRRHGFDVVIGNQLGPMAHLGQCLARDFGIRCVSWGIGSDVHSLPGLSAENLRLLQHNLRHGDMILTVCEAMRQLLLQARPTARNIHTFYRGIDLASLEGEVDRPGLRAKLGLSPDRRYMISAGAVQKTKGVYEFYEAFKQLAAARSDLAAIWMGEGPERAALRKLAHQAGLGDRFRAAGTVPRNELLRYMRAADLMAFPSYAEGLPNVVVEALAAGMPTITSDVGGVSEVVHDQVTGLLVEPGDVRALARAIEYVLDNADKASEMAKRGRQFILRHFDVRLNARVLLGVLKHVGRNGSCEDPIPSCDGVRPGELPNPSRLSAARG